MKQYIQLILLALIFSISAYAQGPITGTFLTCVGSSSHVADSSILGGTWSSSNVAIATITSTGVSSAQVTGISAGTCIITYTVGTGFVTATYTVSGILPAAITGTTTFCMGTASTLSDATTGGTWSSNNPGVASVGTLTGVVTGVSAGSAEIFYATGTSCSQSTTVTITSLVLYDSITGPSSVCVGSTTTLSETGPAGTWSSGTPSVATIGTSGVVTGVSTGTSIITYSITTSCGSETDVKAVHVLSTTGSAGTISGVTSVGLGSFTTLSDGVPGGTWTSSNPSVATAGATTGIVSGIATGTATITYTVSGCGGPVYTTTGVTVSVINRISGNIDFGYADSLGTIKVWLITYNPLTLMLDAVDSISMPGAGLGSVYYQFMSKPADSYRVKAAFIPITFSPTGLIPTYHHSSFYWYDAAVFYHSTSSANDTEDIIMASGMVTSGPGFIGGNILTGANKGTSSTMPATGLLVFVLNSSGAVLQQTYTDTLGNYSFSNLPLGTNYSIYPELINYRTTAYTNISLTSASPSMSDANFGQHTLSHTILPVTSSIKNVLVSGSSVIAFPNPTSGKLNIQWNELVNEKGTIRITDITGREVYFATLSMNQGSGTGQVDISALANGLYLVTVKSPTFNYNSKIELAH